MRPTVPDGPSWSARPFSDRDRDAVLSMFTEPDFHFRTETPDTRPEWEVLELLGTDTQVLLADGEPVGLYAVETVGSDHACHHQLHLRLRAAAPPSWWQHAFAEVVRALRWDRELVRLTLTVGEFDDRGLAFARAAGLTEEGVLADTVVHRGHRYGYVYFSRIREPRP